MTWGMPAPLLLLSSQTAAARLFDYFTEICVQSQYVPNQSQYVPYLNLPSKVPNHFA